MGFRSVEIISSSFLGFYTFIFFTLMLYSVAPSSWSSGESVTWSMKRSCYVTYRPVNISCIAFWSSLFLLSKS